MLDDQFGYFDPVIFAQHYSNVYKSQNIIKNDFSSTPKISSKHFN